MMCNPDIRAPGDHSPLSRGKSLLYAGVAFVGTLLILEVVSRLLLPPPSATVMEEHDDLIRVLGLPDMVELFEPDDDLFWHLRPNLDHLHLEGTVGPYPVSFDVSTNARGLRGGPIPREKGKFRVLALGNSCTFGVGVDDDRTWPARLESLLERSLHRDVLVINAGVPGYSAWQGRRFLETRGFDLEPDLVISSFGFNDAATWSSHSDPETARLLVSNRVEGALRRSRAFTGLERVLTSLPEGSEDESERGEKPRLSAGEFYENLTGIRDLCADHDIPLIFLVWPFRKQIEERNAEPLAYQNLVLAVAEADRVPVIDLVPSFLKAGGSLYVDNIHGNARGCAVAAEAIAATLERARVR